ncbi:glycosyltransferase family 4 protein [Tabrizicola sp. WMC-M-20]|nr:glycosyltransferase family 4 protein [Tabrizicola sp. WMC-M-20]
MKIAFSIDRFVGVTGGAERVLCMIASGLAQRGHMVEILTADPEDGSPFYSLDPAVRIVRLSPSPGLRSRLAGKINNALHRFGLTHKWTGSYLAWYFTRRPLHRLFKTYLNQSRPDVGIAFMRGGIGLMVHGAPGFPKHKIASLHNMPAEELDLRFDTRFLYQRLIGIQAIKEFDWITVLSPGFLDGLSPELRARACAIPNIISASEDVTPWDNRESLVVAVSRLVSNKRIDMLIAAWANVVGRFPAWRLEIYGQGPEAATLQARIADLGLESSVRLMGVTRDIDTIHGRARLMAHPSAFEGFPLAVGEALTRGVPVLGFADCPGLNHLVQDGVNGRLVPPEADRVAALSDVLAELLADPAQLQSLGENGPSSMSPYAAEAILDQWEALLQEVMHEGEGSAPRG